MRIDDIRQGFGTLRETVAEGWERLRRSASGALARFRPGTPDSLPAPRELDDETFGRGALWAMIGGDVFEDDRQVLVRLEAPGMEKEDFQLDVQGDALRVRGEKRFQRESSDGRWRVVQCAYGSFERHVPLPAPVEPDGARASYRNGVLRVELPKRAPGRPQSHRIAVQ
jgi:HSP20 family protein